jgi:hypothetical protein
MTPISRFTLLVGALTLAFWLAESRPALATPYCYYLDQTPCYPNMSTTPCIGPLGEVFQCDCLDNRWQCPW